MARGELVGDVRARVRRPDDEHGAVAQLLRPAIRAGVQLPDRRVEVRREGRDARVAEGARRDHHVVGLPASRPRGHEVVPVAALDRVHRDPGHDREPEARGVPLQEVAHVGGRRERVAGRGKAHPRQPVHSRGRVQPQRRPAATPAVSDAHLRIQDHVLAAATSEVVARREPGLAGAHDHGLDVPGGAGLGLRGALARIDRLAGHGRPPRGSGLAGRGVRPAKADPRGGRERAPSGVLPRPAGRAPSRTASPPHASRRRSSRRRSVRGGRPS